jgi:hypothetical protein
MSRSNSKAKRKLAQLQNKLRNAHVIHSGDSARALAAILPTTSTPAQPQPTVYQNDGTPPPLKGGRQTQPTNVNPLGMLSYSFLARRQYQNIDLTDLETLGHSINGQQLLEMFADLSPHISKALGNKVLSVNSGYTYQVKTKDGKRDLTRAKALLDEIIEGLNKDAGGLDALIDSWTSTVVLQGAAAAEIALTDDLKDVQDVYAVQPWSIHFERDVNQNLVPFQQQVASAGYGIGYGVAGYPYKRLNPFTFTYIPYQNFPDDPYGRSPISSVLQVIAFDLQMQKDIRQWAHTNAWGRLDVKIVEEMLYKNAPNFQMDPTGQKKRQWVTDQVGAFRDSYSQIKSDDAFIHTDAVEFSAVDPSGKTFQVDGLLRAIDRRMFMALQELPVLMGSNEGTTETHGSIQFEIYAKHINSIQRLVANLLEKLFSVALQVYGISAKVLWVFNPVRSSDRLADAQAEALENQTAAFQRDQGWKDQDEVAVEITGHKAVAEPKEAPAPVIIAPQGADNTKPGKDNKPAPKAKVDSGSGDTSGEGVDAGSDSEKKAA